MGQPALAPVPFELVYEDGEPMEYRNHFLQMCLLLDVIRKAVKERGRSDFFAGGNMFVYYSSDQARAVADDVKKGRRTGRAGCAARCWGWTWVTGKAW